MKGTLTDSSNHVGMQMHLFSVSYTVIKISRFFFSDKRFVYKSCHD